MIITVTIPDDKKDAVIEAFATTYKYQDVLINEAGEEIPNPVSKGEFALNTVKSFIKEVYVAAQVKPVEDTKATIVAEALAEIDLITVN